MEEFAKAGQIVRFLFSGLVVVAYAPRVSRKPPKARSFMFITIVIRDGIPQPQSGLAGGAQRAMDCEAGAESPALTLGAVAKAKAYSTFSTRLGFCT